MRVPYKGSIWDLGFRAGRSERLLKFVVSAFGFRAHRSIQHFFEGSVKGLGAQVYRHFLEPKHRFRVL